MNTDKKIAGAAISKLRLSFHLDENDGSNNTATAAAIYAKQSFNCHFSDLLMIGFELELTMIALLFDL